MDSSRETRLEFCSLQHGFDLKTHTQMTRVTHFYGCVSEEAVSKF